MGHVMTEEAISRRRCPQCSALKKRMSECARANKRAGRHARETLWRVSNAPLRERYEELTRNGVPAAVIAQRAGWAIMSNGTPRGDTQRLKRKLGLIPESTRKGSETYTRIVDRVTYETAVTLCRALGADPVEVGV
jgi:hypothetical protein